MSKYRYVEVDVDMPIPVHTIQIVKTKLRCACLLDEFGNPHVKHVYANGYEVQLPEQTMTKVQLQVFSKSLEEDFCYGEAT